MQIFRKTQKIGSVLKPLLHPTLSSLPFKKRTYSSRKFPDLLYVPHILRWLAAKIKFKYLQKTWDPQFSEGGFIYGSSNAICRITEIINENDPDKLKSLLTNNAELALRKDMETKLTINQRNFIKLEPRDIKLFVPMRVQLVKHKDNRKFCFVLLKSLSMKWHEEKNVVKLALIVIESEFKREYSDGVKPEWIISLFNIVQCVLIGGNTVTS